MRRLPQLALALLAGTTLLSPQLATASGEGDPKIPFEKYKLDNGLEVILHQDKRVPLVAVDIWYHVGAQDDTVGKSGFAHLFEHMMFQGSEHTGKDMHFPILKQIGVSDVNGTTNFNRTNYYEVVPSHYLETALWLESDRMGYLLPMINEESLANQRDVVRNERRQSHDNQPYSVAEFTLAELMYPENNQYRYLVIGKHEDLESATVNDVKAFFNKWYAPANATLTISGDFEVEDAKKLIEKWFGSFPKSEKPARSTSPFTPITSVIRKELKDPLAPLTRIQYAWHSPKLLAGGDAELDILANALGREGTGRLFKRLVLETQLAQSVSVYQESRSFSGIFQIEIDLNPGTEVAKVEAIVAEELEKVRKEAISQKEFDRAVIGFESNYIWGLEGLLARADTLQQYNDLTGNPDYITQDLDRYRKSSPAKVLETVNAYLGAKNYVQLITVPAAPEAAKGGK